MSDRIGTSATRSTEGPISIGTNAAENVLVAITAERGPINVPTFVSSFSRFVALFGGALVDGGNYSSGYEAIKTLFDHGISNIWVTRIVGVGAVTATISIGSQNGTGSFLFTAKGPGVWANGLNVVTSIGTKAGTFKIGVYDGSTLLEREIDNLRGTAGSLHNVGALSDYITMSVTGAASDGEVPTAGTNTLAGGADDNAPTDSVIAGGESNSLKSGLYAFRDTKFGRSFILAPDLDYGANARSEMKAQIEPFFHYPHYSGAPANASAASAIMDKGTISSFCGSYTFPRGITIDGNTGDRKAVPMCAHTTALYVKSLDRFGPGKIPAGYSTFIDFIDDIERNLDGSEKVDTNTSELLIKNGINPIWTDGTGAPKLLGGRSVNQEEPEWKYVHSGYLWLVIASDTTIALRGFTYDIADVNLFRDIEDGVYAYLKTLFERRAFSGTLPDRGEQADKSKHAFGYSCNEALLSPLDKTDGVIRVKIWYKPADTAETIDVDVANRRK